MKKNTSIRIIISTALLSTAVAVGSSLAWFSPSAQMSNDQNPIIGSVEDEYYASGIGSESDPFVITKPRHLYNLAWLQYLGFYNKSSGVDNHQFFFVLGDNVDMSEFGPIPPIGTELNPFVGNFDGQGYVVSNVTISNTFSDYNAHPSSITDWDNSTKKQPHILGFFGVLGEYTNGNKPTNYDTAKNEFINTGLTGVNIKSEVTNCLVGIAAGCSLDSNLNDTHTPMKNIVVDNSKITLPSSATTAYDSTNLSSKVSDYTLVGYTNNTAGAVRASKSVYGVNSDTNITFNATEEGNVQGWGGSIDMRTMYDGLVNVYNSYSADSEGIYKYYQNRTIVEDVDGNEISNTQSNPVNNSQTGYTTSGGTYAITHYGYEQKNSAGKVTSSYTLARRDTSQYIYLYGHNDAVSTGQNQTVTKTYYPDSTAFNISLNVSGTTHYLIRNNTSITDTTTQADATKWVYGSDGYIKTSTDGDTVYYLYASSTTTLAVTTNQNQANIWNKSTSGNNTSFSVSDGQYAYYIYYDGGWTLKQTEAPYFYIRSGTNHYLTRNGNNITDQTSQNNATKWYWNGEYFYPNGDDSVGLVYYYYRTTGWNGSTTVYQLYISDPTSSRVTPWQPSVNVDDINGSTTASISVEGKSYSYWDGETTRTYYLRYNSGWTYDTSSRTVTIQRVTSASYYVSTPTNGTLKMKTTETYEQPATYETKHTYFPLRQNDNDGTPLDTNTGYVISGSDDSMAGDIRVSYYAKSGNLSNGVNTVYTINDSGRQTVTNNGTDQNIAKTFEKYSDSKSSMASILNGTNIYGLHFMNANIAYGDGISAVAESATINGQTYSNYELPTNCIDFNLKEKGYINFFAGTYFSGNNSFFSLYQVERNGSNKITTVKKVSEVLSDGVQSHSYQYKFSNGTYSVPFKFNGDNKVTLTDGAYTEYSTMGSAYTGYSTVFKTSWIEVNSLTSNYAYYFEIPMNDGEYCLGSVSGGTGAYLMYLDIGANAAKTNRTIFYEKFSINEKTFSHPVGVALESLPTQYSSGTTTVPISDEIDYSDSACMEIQVSATGEYSMDRDADDNVVIKRAQSNKAPPIYAGEDVTIYAESISNSNAVDPTPISTKEYDVRQMQYFDYTLNTDTLTVTTFTDYYATDGTITRTIVQQKYSGNAVTDTPANTYTYDPRGDTPVDERSSMKIYNTTSGVKYGVDAIINTNTVQIDSNKLSNTLILEIKLNQVDGDSYDESVSVVIAIDSNLSTATETYYKYNGLTIVITPESGTINIKVVDYEGSFTMTIYNYGTTTPTTSTSTPNSSITISGTTVTGEGQTITVTP